MRELDELKINIQTNEEILRERDLYKYFYDEMQELVLSTEYSAEEVRYSLKSFFLDVSSKMQPSKYQSDIKLFSKWFQIIEINVTKLILNHFLNAINFAVLNGVSLSRWRKWIPRQVHLHSFHSCCNLCLKLSTSFFFTLFAMVIWGVNPACFLFISSGNFPITLL